MDKLVGEVFSTKGNDVLFLVVGNDQDNEYNLVVLNDFNNKLEELELNYSKTITKEELTTNFLHVPYVDFTGNLKLKYEEKVYDYE